MKQNFRFLLKEENDKNFKIYEDKLRNVDIKIQELLSAKENHDIRTAEKIACEMTAKAITDLNNQHILKVNIYIYIYIYIHIYIFMYIYICIYTLVVK
jgi:hypothetical protein